MEENSIIKDKKDKMLMIVIGCLIHFNILFSPNYYSFSF